MRVVESRYMHWAKTREPVRFHLGSSAKPVSGRRLKEAIEPPSQDAAAVIGS